MAPPAIAPPLLAPPLVAAPPPPCTGALAPPLQMALAPPPPPPLAPTGPSLRGVYWKRVLKTQDTVWARQETSSITFDLDDLEASFSTRSRHGAVQGAARSAAAKEHIALLDNKCARAPAVRGWKGVFGRNLNKQRVSTRARKVESTMWLGAGRSTVRPLEG
eukprot:1519151-Pleurochrysis_carterae.AAC.1